MEDTIHYLNLTEATIVIVDDNGNHIVIMPPDNAELREELDWRVEFIQTDVAYFAGNGAMVPIGNAQARAATGLPEPRKMVRLIVSQSLADCAKSAGRNIEDLLVPYDPHFIPADNALVFTRFARA